jgi:hypothetical protein
VTLQAAGFGRDYLQNRIAAAMRQKEEKCLEN